jgi:hypothetical protein
VSEAAERRCPNCRALVSEDAEWCGQCFVSLRETVAEAAVVPQDSPVHVAVSAGTAEASGAERKQATWTCPACGHENALELDACEVCFTPFASLFREPDEGPKVDPRTAVIRSLIFPGLGHAAVGKTADGLARGMLFAWTFGTTILILFSGVSAGPMLGMLVLYGALSVAVYVFSAFEAYRLAQGGGVLVTSRILLWFAVALVLVSVLMAVMLIFTAARR